MEIESTQYMHINMRGDEIAAMRRIARFAQVMIEGSPVIPMHGCPLHRQAGMFGNDLNTTTDMIDKILSATEYLNKF